jgi:hypothetical protein
MSFGLHISEDGQTCPYFRCDVCGELITDASDGLLVWHYDRYEEGFFQPAVVCKSQRCDRDHMLASMELDTALVYLLRNSKMSPEALKQATRKAHLLGLIR